MREPSLDSTYLRHSDFRYFSVGAFARGTSDRRNQLCETSMNAVASAGDRTASPGPAMPRLGSVPLFPQLKTPSAPIIVAAANYMLQRGEDPTQLLKLERGLWHPFRRAWASERKGTARRRRRERRRLAFAAGVEALISAARVATVLRVIENELPVASESVAEERRSER